MVFNEALDHKERGEGSQIIASFNLSHPKISSLEGGWCVPDSAGGKNDISAEAYKEGKVLNSENLNEIVDISFEISHDSSFQSSFEDQFDNMLEELHFGQLSFGRQRRVYVESCHFFYDLVAEYMERLGNSNDWLYLYCKDQLLCYNLLPLCLSSLILIKHEEETKLLDKLLDWLHWKSEFT